MQHFAIIYFYDFIDVTNNLVTMCASPASYVRQLSLTHTGQPHTEIGGPVFANLFTSIANACRCLLSTVVTESSGDHKNSKMELGYSSFGW